MANVTSFEELKAYSEGQVVELPQFAEGQPFVAKIRRPSLLMLAKSGRIPNALMGTATKMFVEGKVDDSKPEVLSDMFNVFDTLCEAAFVEPTYSEIIESGVELTDEQYMFIFNYAQYGVKMLDSFRSKPINPKRAKHK